MALVERQDRDGWTQLTLNRPEKLNVLTVAMFHELRSHVEALQNDTSIGCVVLRGAGRCFSAGNDLADIGAGEEVPSRDSRSETLWRLQWEVLQCEGVGPDAPARIAAFTGR
ncbi:MAG TPA: enoyl-CoA hydratase/isomerase family protein [Mycobacteriales bacterium]|nr:enoyl-CoA hydratase/isomerase family protein [Mycobacteriales bacterium]